MIVERATFRARGFDLGAVYRPVLLQTYKDVLCFGVILTPRCNPTVCPANEPGKSPNASSSYHPISLTSCVGSLWSEWSNGVWRGASKSNRCIVLRYGCLLLSSKRHRRSGRACITRHPTYLVLLGNDYRFDALPYSVILQHLRLRNRVSNRN